MGQALEVSPMDSPACSTMAVGYERLCMGQQARGMVTALLLIAILASPIIVAIVGGQGLGAATGNLGDDWR